MLEVQDLHVRDDRGHETVRGVSLEVRAGEILGIAGVAGNGQEELVEALTGLRPPTSGSVMLNGEDVTGHRPTRPPAGRACHSSPATGTASVSS